MNEQDSRRARRGTRWAAVIAGGVSLAVVAIVVIGALDDAPHDGGARLPAASDSSGDRVLDRTITVVGQGTASAPPDAAVVRLGVQTSAATANDALDAANRSAQTVIDLVTESGVDDSDVQTTDVSVWPRYSNDGTAITGYEASNRVVVTVRDLDSVGSLIDAATGLVGNDIRIDGLSFVLDDASAVDGEARTNAVADARARAEGYAEAAGIELGEVLAISETSVMDSPQPVYSGAAEDSSDRVPIASGEQTRSASVTVVYAIG